jgi:hypothetical protein
MDRNNISRGTQTDVYELYINGMSKPEEHITKDGFKFQFKSQGFRMAFYTCTSSTCQKKAYVFSSGKVLVRGPDHNHQ